MTSTLAQRIRGLGGMGIGVLILAIGIPLSLAGGNPPWFQALCVVVVMAWIVGWSIAIRRWSKAENTAARPNNGQAS